ncbi:tRNA (adenosine(37)-N6)-threonylcarbamoyltransferase complex transferase subunit TsaD [Patescibacteria group bacterium]|nr:tRNA (adenosine(37)-N6)-threonylcarbamoyltransferase complex transferase subunit TsaD [Patescibacteria group bacterium]
MIILAIETSCDDTAIAIVEVKNKKFKVLSNIVSSQIEAHQEYGGVFPSLAKREHEKNLPAVLKRSLDPLIRANKLVDAVAVTVGPGLDPCLWTGVNFAKDLAQKWNLPIIPVNHIEAHILVNFQFPISNFQFPAMALIVSGGHTQLILIKDPPAGGGKYKILGETRDDAAGECFDKVARILGLGYPGGPIVAAEAVKACGGRASAALPRPMINTNDYDFSFSGLKTAVLYNFKNQPVKIRKSKKYISEMCKEVQQAVIDVLIKKTTKASREYGVKTIILGGGVTANTELRKQFKKRFKNVLIPPKKLSTDNAVMIAIAGYYNIDKATKKYGNIKAKPNLRIRN